MQRRILQMDSSILLGGYHIDPAPPQASGDGSYDISMYSYSLSAPAARQTTLAFG
jgi:hypothetical protein